MRPAPLDSLLTGKGPPPSGTLAAIAARAGERRRKRLKLAYGLGALVLVASSAGIVANSLGATSSRKKAATSPERPLGERSARRIPTVPAARSWVSLGAPANGTDKAATTAGTSFSASSAEPGTRLFSRTKNGVELSASTSDLEATGLEVPLSCKLTTSLLVEASDDGATTRLVVPRPSRNDREPIEVLESVSVEQGGAPPSDVLVVIVGGKVDRVTARFSNGTSDEMRARDGVAALVGEAGLPVIVTALSHDGSVLEHTRVEHSDAVALPSRCDHRTTTTGSNKR